MDMRVGETSARQYWRVTGVAASDTPPAPQRVTLEVWVEIVQSLSNGKTQKKWEREVLSLDPSLARKLGGHLIEMADHAEEQS